MSNYDCVWFWVGGTERGQWNRCEVGADVNATVAEVKRMGYVTYPGRASIGEPSDGAPTEEEFAAVGV